MYSPKTEDVFLLQQLCVSLLFYYSKLFQTILLRKCAYNRVDGDDGWLSVLLFFDPVLNGFFRPACCCCCCC